MYHLQMNVYELNRRFREAGFPVKAEGWHPGGLHDLAEANATMLTAGHQAIKCRQQVTLP